MSQTALSLKNFDQERIDALFDRDLSFFAVRFDRTANCVVARTQVAVEPCFVTVIAADCKRGRTLSAADDAAEGVIGDPLKKREDIDFVVQRSDPAFGKCNGMPFQSDRAMFRLAVEPNHAFQIKFGGSCVKHRCENCVVAWNSFILTVQKVDVEGLFPFVIGEGTCYLPVSDETLLIN